MTIDPRVAEWRDWETKRLHRRICPYSGLPLTPWGAARPESLSCAVCDCFGYDPDDPRIGAKQ